MPTSDRPDSPDGDLDAVLRRIVTARAAELIEQCRATDRTIATAESLTGGAIAAALAVTPGAGDVFKGSVVTYRSETKHDVLGVRRGPVVAPDAAVEMACAAISMFACDLAVAVTGVAGPDTEEGVAVGTVFAAAADRDDRTVVHEHRFSGSPSDVRAQTMRAAVELLAWFARSDTSEDDYQATSSQPM